MENLKETAVNMGINTMNDLLNTVVSKAPEVLDQLIFLCTIKSMVECVGGILSLLTTYLTLRYVLAKPDKNTKCRAEQWADEENLICFVITTLIVSLSLGAGISLVNIDWLYLLASPKAYILMELGKIL